MKYICSIQLIIISLLIFSIKSLDPSTQSNYNNVTLIRLKGLFTPDFEEEIIQGELNLTFQSNINGSEIILDTKYLEIISIEDELKKPINYSFGEFDENLGTPLIIHYDYNESSLINITINYKTTKEGSSAQFLTKEQTIGKKYPYFFTSSEMILGRELLPIQDTPAVKFTFNLGIKVDKNLRGMISGLFEKVEEVENKYKIYYYYQNIPVPSYLIALAAGNIVNKSITENISVYTEPEYIETVYNELIDIPEILKNATSYMGDYEWEQYNILVLPYSFPYSGMENPCLSFCSPCLINGDKSLVDIIAHELIHSWSGNLVTNENWSDFWLNEGITMFLQRKIIGMWKGVDYSKMDSILGLSYINSYLLIFGENSTFTTLRPNLTGISPDDSYSDIPYEKGYNFLYFIEGIIGEEIMKKFFQSYFIHFKYKSIDLYQFKNYFIEFCKNNSVTDEKLNKINWDEWIFKPGKCPIDNDFSNKYKDEVDIVLEKVKKGEIDDNLEKIVQNWMHTSKTVFMTTLEEEDDEFISDKLHDFFTKKLKFYEGQDFLVSVNYFRFILKKTDKFYENELESLIKFLSKYGALDYMVNLYEYFYKRDEIKAVETLKNLKSFYHNAMYEMAEKEIEKSKKEFPILTINLKEKDKCLKLDELNSSKLYIISDEYEEKLDNLNITNGINIEVDNKSIGVECILNSEEKYCLLNDSIKKSGEYILKIPNRIQKINYAIKIHESKIKIYTKDSEVNKESTKKDYTIDYGKKESEIIEIIFKNEPDEKLRVMNDNKEIKCDINNLKLQCTINNNILPVNSEKPNDLKKYELKIIDLCGNEKYSFNINVQNSKNSMFYVIIIILGILALIIVLFIICKVVHKRKKINDEDINKTNILVEN